MLPELVTTTIVISTLATQASAWATSYTFPCEGGPQEYCPYKCPGQNPLYQAEPCSNFDTSASVDEIAGDHTDFADI